MQETTNSVRPIRISPAVFLAALSLAFVTGWLGRFILYWLTLPACLVLLVIGMIKVVSASDITGISSSKNPVSYVLSPEDLARWRSIKRGMDRHEVTAILGQPDGPPVVVNSLNLGGFSGTENIFSGKILYKWGSGSVYFEPNAGPVFHVMIPEYV